MTNEEIREIEIMQKRGMGPTKIADITKQPVSAIKAYVVRHPLEPEDVCLNCGKPLAQDDHRRKKTFCSRVCKSKWWYAHPHMMTKQTLNTFVCPVCGKEFSDYGKRVYCSVGCYAIARRKNNGRL